MLKIMITCGGGFSSSALVTHLNKETQEKGLSDKAEFVFKPFDFGGIGDLVESVDIVMLCPHLAYQSKQLAAQYPDKPFYVIPTRLYGLMAAEEFIEDAEDAIEGWKETGMNPFHFEGEETAIRVMRTVSHRKWLKSQG
jgi:PTS system cellobiose-specific IIB component